MKQLRLSILSFFSGLFLGGCGLAVSSSGGTCFVDGAISTSCSPLVLTGSVTTIVGNASTAGNSSGIGTGALLNGPFALSSDGTNLFVVDYDSHVIRKVVLSTLAVTTLAGGAGSPGSLNGTGTNARFNNPTGAVTDGTYLYVADSGNNSIRKIVIATGAVTTLVSGLHGPAGLATDGTNLYVTEVQSHTIDKVVISTGVVSTLAGTTNSSGTADGIGAAARFNGPQGITTDGTTLYVSDSSNHTIRQITISTGNTTTLAGTAGVSGTADGYGSAAGFNIPTQLASDGTQLFIADSNGFKIRTFTFSTGQVTTLAGSGTSGSVDGTGTSAQFSGPTGLLSTGGVLYVSDFSAHTIKKIQ